MITTASSLTRFGEDPAQPRAWLRAFRCGTPRCQRQHLIDTLDVNAVLEELARDRIHVTAENYGRVVYVVAARRLPAPAAASAAEREALRHRMARVFELTAVRRDADAAAARTRSSTVARAPAEQRNAGRLAVRNLRDG